MIRKIVIGKSRRLSAAAAGEAAQNAIAGIANDIKGEVMKAEMNTLIAKIGIAVAIVAVIAVGAVFFMKNSGEEEASNVETLAGEMLDVDALTGGYNLQIAWATGYLAGISV